jgi:hypothetical protein
VAPSVVTNEVFSAMFSATLAPPAITGASLTGVTTMVATAVTRSPSASVRA